MKVLIFYRPDSEHARAVEDFLHDFEKNHPGSPIELINVDTPAGDAQAGTYDVIQYPTIVATGQDGSTMQRWDNGQMPLMSEVAYYANQT